MNARLLHLPLSAALLVTAARAAQNLDSDFRKNGDAVTAAVEPQRAILQKCSAVIRDGRKEIAFGTIVSADGYLLTKLSEVAGVQSLSVLVDTSKYDGRVVATDPAWDVALVKIEATGLQPVAYPGAGDVPQGTWVVANGASSLTRRRALVGIISAKPREIPTGGGPALGVILNPKAKAPEIEEVSEHSGAREAGLRKGDVITSVDGKKVSRVSELGEALKDKKVGSSVKLGYRRDGKEATADVRLIARGEMMEKSRNDQMSGDYSMRRTGFPRVLQHDILGNKSSVGGPLLDLDGRCVGMNIARADRAQSFAIPAADLKALAERLMKQ